MIYLSGCVRADLIGLRPDLGVILTPRMGNVVDLTRCPWGADTDCYGNPEGYETGGYLAWLRARSYAAATCLFATAPDVVGDAVATWERAEPVLPLIRALGLPAALVAQDGLEDMAVPWDGFDVLFIGGTTEWKLSHHARDLIAEARRHGKRVHLGRTNSQLRLETAAMIGCDSADGTYLAFGPDKNTPKLLRWLDRLRASPPLILTRIAA